jgi:Fe-S cluster assembly protein SufD
MTAFLDSQAAQQRLLTPSPCANVQVWRAQAMAQAVRVGFPHNKLERWKYAPLRPLAGKAFHTDADASPSVDAAQLPPAPRIVFVNGRFSAERTQIDGIPGLHVQSLADALRGDDERSLNFLGRQFSDAEGPFASLNTALAEQGALIKIDEQAVIEAPLHLIFIGAAVSGSSHYLRHLIDCRSSSRLTVVEHHISQAGDAGLGNQLMHIHLDRHARLKHIRIQRRESACLGFSRHDAVLSSHAEYRRLDIETGSHLSRHELNISLQGEQARVHSGGVLWSTGSSTLDTRLTVRHQAPDAECRLVWRGLADDKARVNFYGGIHIEQGADGADAALSNKNLLLGRQAQVNTQPALEIYADEVKAAHGATVGQLDDAALFYLRSRGVPKAQAEKLLSQAFYAEAFAGIADEALLSALRPYLPAILRREQEDGA